MTQHRTRRRTREAKSAIRPTETCESPRDQLNEATPGTTRCAWPGCRAPLEVWLDNSHEPVSKRFGVLCETHAVDVAFAVIQTQKTHNFIEHIFTKQTSEQAVRLSTERTARERRESDKAALRGDREGFVYYLMVGERLKIGYSVDVKRRMRAYPPGSNLLAVEPGDRSLERQRHQQFAGSRTDGREWFRPTPDILELVAEIVANYGEPKRFAHHYRRNEDPVRITRSA